jgi:ribonuclease HII
VVVPDFSLETALDGVVCGIDEAGRGPWAGPVVAAAAVIERARAPRSLLSLLDDSKALSARARAHAFAAMEDAASAGTLRHGIGAASPEEIDALNILNATHLAMRRALDALGPCPDWALVDGNRAPALPCRVKTVVGGDGRALSIAAASILAKVTRDRVMTALAIQNPGFGWERNMGYGTAEHRAALAKFGPTPHHRRSFAPVAQYLGV